MPVYNKRGILLLPKVIVLNPKDGNLSIAISAVLMYNKTLVYQVYTLGTEGAA